MRHRALRRRLLDALSNTQGETQKILGAVVGTCLWRLSQEKGGGGVANWYT